MSNLKRIISLLICIAMLTSMLASCDTDTSHDYKTNESTTARPYESESDHTHTDTKQPEETTDGIQPHTHTPATAVTEKFVDSSCTATGSYDEVVYCSECQEEISRTEKKIDKKTHEYNQRVATNAYLKTPADCNNAAVYYYSCVCGEKGTTTFTSGDATGHNYTERNTDNKYLASAATGTSAAVYYYSCVCGKAGTETFSYGEASNVPAESISLNKTEVYLEVGDSSALGVAFTPADTSDRNITWVSSNPNVALVNGGVVVGVNPGVTTVIAMSSNGKTASCRVEVSEKTYYAENITLSDSSLEIRVGEHYTLTATINPDYTTDKSLVWSSSAPDVVKVEDGKITALTQGSATITATTTNGISASCTVTAIYVPVTEIVIDSSLIYVDAGETVSVGVTLLPKNATFLDMTYTSSNESVATVSNGVITAISDGIAVITVSVDGIISNSFTVFVENSAGIKYQENGSGYRVLSIPNPQETVLIPKTYKGKDVNAIASNAFGTACSVIKNLYISKSATLPDASLTNCTRLEKLVLYGGGLIWPASSDPYDFYRYFEGMYITLEVAPGALRPTCGSYSHSWEYCDGTCSWEVTNSDWAGWVRHESGGSVEWYYPCNLDYGAFFKRDDVIDLQNYNGYQVPKLIYVRVYKVPRSLTQFNDGYSDILAPESSTVCISTVDDLKIKFNGELLDIPLVSVVSFEDREKLHTIGTHNVTVYYGGFTETMVVNVGHVQNTVEENRVEATCTVDGHYDLVIYCSTCKTEVSRTEITLEAHHTPKSAVEENCVEATCTEDGSYDSVIYCSICEEELSREKMTIAELGHTPAAAVEENRIEATCTEDGSYDSVIYCAVCDEELSRETITIKYFSSNLKFTSNGNNTCYVSGIGDCADTDIYIPSVSPTGDTVTSIGEEAFNGCDSLTSIVIPNSVTSIGDQAFWGCRSLTSIIIPNSVMNIGIQAFGGCHSLTSITIPDSVTSIDISAFDFCYDLKSIKFDGTVAQWKKATSYATSYFFPTKEVVCSNGKVSYK